MSKQTCSIAKVWSESSEIHGIKTCQSYFYCGMRNLLNKNTMEGGGWRERLRSSWLSVWSVCKNWGAKATHVQNCQQTSNGTLGISNCTVEVFQTMGTLWDCTIHPTVPFSVPNNGNTSGLYYSSHCPISHRLQGSSHPTVPWEELDRRGLYYGEHGMGWDNGNLKSQWTSVGNAGQPSLKPP